MQWFPVLQGHWEEFQTGAASQKRPEGYKASVDRATSSENASAGSHTFTADLHVILAVLNSVLLHVAPPED